MCSATIHELALHSKYVLISGMCLTMCEYTYTQRAKPYAHLEFPLYAMAEEFYVELHVQNVHSIS